MNDKTTAEAHQVCRSLIQKLVRRGCVSLIPRVVNHFVDIGELSWIQTRMSVILYEECWPLGVLSEPKPDADYIIRTLQKLALTTKQKDATGLGVLAYELSNGDNSVLQGDNTDSPLKLLSNAIKDPFHFWDSIRGQTSDNVSLMHIEHAQNAYQLEGVPLDRVFMQAAALLSVMGDVPAVSSKNDLECPESDFPFWIVIDKHTDEGKAKIQSLSGMTGIDARLIAQLLFYFEGSIENELSYSYWWDREVSWRLKQLGVSITDAETTWKKVKPSFLDLLDENEKQLRHHIAEM
jgi:hypothetical protein